ncbi:MAG: aspartate kinase [Prolixibacteraceae bacterium]|jgi:aspartate kinase|nr:aspartate kinase [Prolixibacteraceae bacterium]
MRVFKFGGASVKDAKGVKNLASIVAKSEGNLVVVISAMGKMTNAFEFLIKKYFNKDESKWEEFALIKKFHNQILDDLFDNSDEIFNQIDSFYQRIEDRIERVPSLDFDFEYDQLVGYGELLSTNIVSAYLNKTGQKNIWKDIRFSLKTNDKWRDATVDWELSEFLIQKDFSFDEERLYVTQGFLGATVSDLTTTLGREGSDFSAAVLGRILGAERVEIWKDVPGILNADPQYFENPKKINSMSYREAVELTFFGAKVIHPKTIKPLENSNIPLHVRSFLKPEARGTIISDEKTSDKLKKLPVFILKTRQVLITISQPDFSFMDEESMSWVFGIFSDLSMKINLIQQSALNLSVSVDIPEHGVMELIERLSEQFETRYNDGLDLLTIRYYTPEAIEKEVSHRKVYVEQKSRTIARYLVKSKLKKG